MAWFRAAWKFNFILLQFATLRYSTYGWSMQQTQDSATTISSVLQEEFSRLSHYDAAERGLNEKIGKKLKEEPVNIQQIAKNFKEKLEPYLKDKMKALRGLVKTVEDLTLTSPQIRALFEGPVYPFHDYVNLRQFERNESLSEVSGIHIPIEVFANNSEILRDIAWTGNSELEKTFENNAIGADRTVFRQYIATETGITRVFPARKWILEPRVITLDLFDPRFRPWYTAAVVAPKDVLFLLDYSGSVTGETLQLMNITVQTILSSLTANDYIKAIWYNKKVGSLLEGCFDKFMPATSRNKVILLRHLAKQSPMNQANFPQALNRSFIEFEKFENDTDLYSEMNYGSGGHKILILMTDGTEEWAQNVVDKYVPLRPDRTRDVTIRVFGLAMGFGGAHIPALYWLSCINQGYYSVIDSVPDIKREARSFIPVLSRTLALTYHNLSTENRPISWSGPYMDAQGAGGMITVSIPIVNQMPNTSNQKFMGVAGIDIKISALKSLVLDSSLGPETYVFASDNNGYVLFHPNYDLPEPDLQMIRRTACYSIMPESVGTKQKKTLFGPVDEGILRQIGLMDSTETLDIMELEPNSTALNDLRTAMINNECDGTVYTTGDADQATRSYTCISLETIPISFGVGTRSKNPVSAQFLDSRSDAELMAIPIWHPDTFVHTFVAPKLLCSGQLDLAGTMTEDRFLRFNESWHGSGRCPFSKDDFATRRILPDFEALEKWTKSWGAKPENSSCRPEDMELYDFMDDPISFAFVQTDGGVTVVYRPPCRQMDVPRNLKGDPWSPSSEYYHFAVELPKTLSFHADHLHVALTKAVQRTRGQYVLGVVGIKLPQDKLTDIWSENEDLAQISDSCHSAGKVCFVMTNNLSVILFVNTTNSWKQRRLLNAGNRHLAILEPIFFEYLYNDSTIVLKVETDFQANCPFYSFYTSPASKIRHFFSAIIGNIFALLSTMYTILWQELFLGIPSQTGAFVPSPVTGRIKDCEYVTPRSGETCIIRYYKYSLNGDAQVKGEFQDGLTNRQYLVAPVKGTNLFFVVMDSGCEDCSIPTGCRCYTSLQINPQRISECDEIRLRYRRRPQEIYDTFHDSEDNSVCAGQNLSSNLLLIGGSFIWAFLMNLKKSRL